METEQLQTQVLVIGAGGAGMMAALAAADAGREVLLLDRSMIGRGGATVMAQMTVAAALGHAEPDDPDLHLADTLAAGRGLCDPELAGLLCAEGPARILDLDAWRAGWARAPAEAAQPGPLAQVMAPGHSRRRCVYVDFLNTGPAVSKALRGQINRRPGLGRRADLMITDILVAAGRAIGAAGWRLSDSRPVVIAAGAVILATGGLTRLYARNSASDHMSGDAHALALRAGAALVDMEFVQFFPIGHLAPRLVGMDPIMWDPFRYKLGGRLLNGAGAEFIEAYGGRDGGSYQTTRDLATYAIHEEVRAGRGSPSGGAWLSFRHVPEAQLRAAFGGVIDRLQANGIDLTRDAVEVAPIAHYHMGGVAVDRHMASAVPGLFAAGEAVGGAHGVNRLSGNAVTEALVFGHVAGRAAAAFDAGAPDAVLARQAAEPALACHARLQAATGGRPGAATPTAEIAALQQVMWTEVGPLREAAGLERALARIRAMADALPDLALPPPGPYDLARRDWYDLRTLLLVGEAVTLAAHAREESRGAHQRADFTATSAAWEGHQRVSWRDGRLSVAWYATKGVRAA